jgi:hypothetical protein
MIKTIINRNYILKLIYSVSISLDPYKTTFPVYQTTSIAKGGGGIIKIFFYEKRRLF